MVVDVSDATRRVRVEPVTFAKTEAEMAKLQIECSQRYRFLSFDHLRRLIVGFQLPAGKIKITEGRGRHTSTAEEILLVSLSRLSFPNRWSDLAERFPGRSRTFFAGGILLVSGFHDPELGLPRPQQHGLVEAPVGWIMRGNPHQAAES